MQLITDDKLTQHPHQEENTALIEWFNSEDAARELRTVYEESAHFEASQELVRNALKTVEDMYQYGTLSLDDYDEIMNVLQDAEI